MDVSAAISPIIDGVYLTGAQGSADHPFILVNNVKIILSFWETPPVIHTGVPFYHNVDVFHFPPRIRSKGTITKYTDIIHEKITNAQAIEKTASVLLCCETGNNFAAAFAVSFLMRRNNWMYDRAKEFVKQRRKVIRISKSMKNSLLEYERKLFPELTLPVEEPEIVKKEADVEHADSEED